MHTGRSILCALALVACGEPKTTGEGSPTESGGRGGVAATGGNPDGAGASGATGHGGTAVDGSGGTAMSGGASGGPGNSGAGGAAGAALTGGAASGGAAATGGGSNESGSAGVTSSGQGGASGGAAGSSSGSPSSGGSGAGGSSASGGVGGSEAGRAGAGTAGGTGGDLDPPPPGPLEVTAAKGRHQHSFRAKDADSAVSFNDNTQTAVVDNRAATLMGKLVLPFAGAGVNVGTLTAAGEFCARRGFHVLAIAAFQDYDIVSRGADFFGNARRTVFEGVFYTHEGEFANIPLTVADGVARRTQKALQYLQAKFPDEDWGYYLQADGSVRWSDVIFTGMSHGASNAARFGFLVRVGRVVSSSGPRDNLCTRVDLKDCGGTVATWFSETSKTPLDRFYAITGKTDAQHTQHLFAMERLGYVGTATAIQGQRAPYGNSHRLIANAGHVDFCGDAAYAEACNYVFGVPTENQAGTPP